MILISIFLAILYLFTVVNILGLDNRVLELEKELAKLRENKKS